MRTAGKVHWKGVKKWYSWLLKVEDYCVSLQFIFQPTPISLQCKRSSVVYLVPASLVQFWKRPKNTHQIVKGPLEWSKKRRERKKGKTKLPLTYFLVATWWWDEVSSTWDTLCVCKSWYPPCQIEQRKWWSQSDHNRLRIGTHPRLIVHPQWSYSPSRF